MPTPEKPRHRSGYSPDEFEQVKSACLTVAVTLGAYLADVCIVGGLVPALLIDTAREPDAEDDPHPGTNDLDVGLALALLDDECYAEISARLRRHTFGSLLVAGGVDLVSIKDAMGHAELATTSRYLHARPASERAATFTAAFASAMAPAARLSPEVRT